MEKRVNLLEGKIASSLTRLALPLMGMSLIQMAYNLTDMIWVGRLGAGAVASIGSAGLFMWLSMGINMLAQVGGQVLVAQKIGAGKMDEAAEYAKASIHLSILLSLLMGAALMLFSKPLISFFNLTGAAVIRDAEIYLGIVGFGLVFSCVTKVLIALITTTGNSHTPFIATTIGLLINIVLDPVLIFGMLGLPALGVMGAAIATVLAQIIVAALFVLYIMKDTHLFNRIHFFSMCRRGSVIDIIKLSFPAAMQNILFPSIAMIISRFVAGFGDDAVAVQRVGSQIESISWMTAEGFSVAINSFIAQNFGAGNIKRAKKGYYTSLGIISIWGCISSAILIFLAAPIFKVFISEPDVVAMGVDYLVILGYSQLFMCIEIITTGAFNGFGKTTLPATINVVLTALRIPAALMLSATVLGLCGIWWSITLSSILKGIFLLLAFIPFLSRVKPLGMQGTQTLKN